MEYPENNNVQELLNTEHEWVQAHQEMNLEVISAILDDEYTQLQSDGKTIGKQDLIASYSTGKRNWEIAKSEPVKIHIMGDVGLLFGKWRGKGENDGQSFDYSTYFLAVYRKRNNKWKLVADASLVQG